jgi:IS30 family transposase
MLANQPLGEFTRNTGLRGYRIQQAQRLVQQRRADASKTIKMTATLIELINLELDDKWSPEQISGWLELNKASNISYETTYQHIWRDKQRGGLLFKSLRRKGKKYQSRSKDKQAGREFIRIEWVLMSGRKLLMIKVELAIGKLILS